MSIPTLLSHARGGETICAAWLKDLFGQTPIPGAISFLHAPQLPPFAPSQVDKGAPIATLDLEMDGLRLVVFKDLTGALCKIKESGYDVYPAILSIRSGFSSTNETPWHQDVTVRCEDTYISFHSENGTVDQRELEKKWRADLHAIKNQLDQDEGIYDPRAYDTHPLRIAPFSPFPKLSKDTQAALDLFLENAAILTHGRISQVTLYRRLPETPWKYPKRRQSALVYDGQAQRVKPCEHWISKALAYVVPKSELYNCTDKVMMTWMAPVRPYSAHDKVRAMEGLKKIIEAVGPPPM